MRFLKQKPGVMALGLALVTVFMTVALASRSTWYRREFVTETGKQIWVLEKDGTTSQIGALKFGNDETTPTVAPGTTNADFWSVKVPFTNRSGSTISRGMVVVASITLTGTALGALTTSLATTTWMGIADGTITNGSVGFMSISGYASVLTSGTVNLGDMLVTTTTNFGYAGATTSTNSIIGSIIGRAFSVGSSSGGFTVIKL